MNRPQRSRETSGPDRVPADMEDRMDDFRHGRNDLVPHPYYPGISVTASGQVFRDGVEIGKQPAPSCGYVVLAVRGADGRKTTTGAHALVCETFHGPRPPGMHVAHGNGIRHDNRAENLRWATRKENWADRAAHGTETRGEKHGQAKLTEQAVREIRTFVAEHGRGSRGQAACLYGVSVDVVSRIVRREAWSHVT